MRRFWKGSKVATVLAGLAIVGLVLIVPAFFRLPQAGLSPIGINVGYISVATISLSCLAILIAMMSGIITDWNGASKAAVGISMFLAVPAALAAIGLLYIGLAGPASAYGYFVIRGVIFGIVFGLPALIVVVLLMPGHA